MLAKRKCTQGSSILSQKNGDNIFAHRSSAAREPTVHLCTCQFFVFYNGDDERVDTTVKFDKKPAHTHLSGLITCFQMKCLNEGAAGRVCQCSCLSRSKYVNRAWPTFLRVGVSRSKSQHTHTHTFPIMFFICSKCAIKLSECNREVHHCLKTFIMVGPLLPQTSELKTKN